MKIKKQYQCSNCGFKSPLWYGQCSECHQWNTLKEVLKTDNPVSNTNKSLLTHQSEAVFSISEIISNFKNSAQKVYQFSILQLNQFWNNGLVSGSLTLLAGEPGLGKSTLSLQILRSLRQKNQIKLLYVTAEESIDEVARRSVRLRIPQDIFLFQSNNLENIEKVILEENPQVVVIDSVQTVFTSSLSQNPGSVSQVTTITSRLLSLSKKHQISIILIGHVTKEGQIAGPKTLEHMVDSVLIMESSDVSNYRTLSFIKHRYGSTDNELLLKMEPSGLEIVTDPSLAMLENIESGIGVCYGLALEKNLPMVVEVQCLVSDNISATGFGKRESIGVKVSRLNTVLAIAEKFLGLNLKNRDVYINLTPNIQSKFDESLDLAILLAVMSSATKLALNQLLRFQKNKNVLFSGRLTLSGKVRKPTKSEEREKTSKKLNFAYNEGIKFTNLNSEYFKI